jgi:hypothetical protein
MKKNIINELNICDCTNIENNLNILDFNEKYIPIINDYFTKTRRKLNIYLNQIEGYCQSINNGNIDLKAAYNYSHKFTHQFRKTKTYIDKIRILKNEKELYIEFEKVINKWKKF